ncbi:MAG: hypoxanthine-guanine phosphoribosyltransferase [Lamprocystis purpurea]|jgi:hypoxanthine phosphoribosyltransferase|uniref:hypoxanthine-guanine phosphoribosyltransferase n=1 Tax=Lamprocystis purpurea TaxID=61598 RepID=UPI00035E4DB2|nr:hypoxanthine-guanine phosphoribosyltransferase [Lamprocystis purpurea]MBV5275555.1 hypoxanthine-guanine phosphoribosyltransferase [Lamprocystis purpurea]
MKLSPETYTAVADRAECLVTQDAMEQAIDRMAEAISERLAGTDPLVLCVMSGGVIATGLLLPRLNFQLRLGHVHVGRYQGTTSGGELVWHYRPTEAIRGEQVLIVDDILDEGVTLDAIVRACREDGAAGVHAAVLVEKRRPHVCEADFVGVQVPDRYLFGYGLDYKSYFRNVPGVFAVAIGDC